MKYSAILYGFIGILGIIFLAPLTSSLLKGFIDSGLLMVVTFLSIVGAVFLTAGICGVISPYFKKGQSKLVAKAMMKPYRLFGSITVFGISLLVTLFSIGYWSEQSAEVMRFFVHKPLAGFLLTFGLLFGGIGLLTVGVCGIERQYLRCNQNLFTILTAISIPSFILLPLVYMVVSSITVGF